MRLDDALLLGLQWLGVGLSLWLALGSALGLLSLLPGALGRHASTAADRVTPAVVRRLLTLALGASLGSAAFPVPAFAANTRPALDTAGSVTASAEVFVHHHALEPDAAGDDPGGTGVRSPGTGSEQATAEVGMRPQGVTRDTAGLDPGARSGGTGSEAATAESRSGQQTHPQRAVGARAGAGPVRAGPVASEGAARPAPGARVGVVKPPSVGYRPTPPPPVADASRSLLLAPTPRASASVHDLVTVRRGDTLWSVARRHLGDDATDAQVAHEWPRWYAANREVIGGDPNAIRPGQQLRPPHSAAVRALPAAAATPAFSPTGLSTHDAWRADGALP